MGGGGSDPGSHPQLLRKHLWFIKHRNCIGALELSHFIEQGFRWASVFGPARAGLRAKPVFILWAVASGVAGPPLPSLVRGVRRDLKPLRGLERGALSPGRLHPRRPRECAEGEARGRRGRGGNGGPRRGRSEELAPPRSRPARAPGSPRLQRRPPRRAQRDCRLEGKEGAYKKQPPRPLLSTHVTPRPGPARS